MDLMTLHSNYSYHRGTYYEGLVNKYEMQLAPGYPVNLFWYLTTPRGLPVEQGEGGLGHICEYGTECCNSERQVQASGGCLDGGIYIFHEYNTSSFKAVSLDDSVFDIPQVCLAPDLPECLFP